MSQTAVAEAAPISVIPASTRPEDAVFYDLVRRATAEATTRPIGCYEFLSPDEAARLFTPGEPNRRPDPIERQLADWQERNTSGSLTVQAVGRATVRAAAEKPEPASARGVAAVAPTTTTPDDEITRLHWDTLMPGAFKRNRHRRESPLRRRIGLALGYVAATAAAASGIWSIVEGVMNGSGY